MAALEAGRNGGSNPFGEIKVLKTEFEQRLTSPRLTDAVNTSNRRPIQDAYRLIEDRWQQAVHTLIDSYMERSTDPLAKESPDETRLAFRTIVID